MQTLLWFHESHKPNASDVKFANLYDSIRTFTMSWHVTCWSRLYYVPCRMVIVVCCVDLYLKIMCRCYTTDLIVLV